MKTHKGNTVPAPSLFPFLSVLVCVVGLLAFLTVSVSLTTLHHAISDLEQRPNAKPVQEFELQISTGGSEHEKTPIVLECTSAGAQMFPAGRQFTETQERSVTPVGPWNGTPYTDLFNDVAATPDDEYILFLVRPDGLPVFDALRAITVWRNRAAATNQKIDYGVELVPENWNLRLADAGRV